MPVCLCKLVDVHAQWELLRPARRELIIIIIIYSHQEMYIKSTIISISSADNKGQLRTLSLTNSISIKATLRLYAVWRYVS